MRAWVDRSLWVRLTLSVVYPYLDFVLSVPDTEYLGLRFCTPFFFSDCSVVMCTSYL